MTVYDLDKYEDIDQIKINGVEYEVGDIPLSIVAKINKIKTGKNRKDIMDQWKPICTEILSIRNKNVDLSNVGEEKIKAFIHYIQ